VSEHWTEISGRNRKEAFRLIAAEMGADQTLHAQIRQFEMDGLTALSLSRLWSVYKGLAKDWYKRRGRSFI
jgi:hypothetical protein